ncbi:hypothetical protein MNBD_GAMMA03-1560 [hydrothermal vent metagenome]|uniref:Uncharacterized protein n=1 Tax=hydrothermal vent metagenome TaxID=652676 RepID=A0A3B0W615_9ZZZZ
MLSYNIFNKILNNNSNYTIVCKKNIQIQFKLAWLSIHPLTYADLQAEAKYLKALDVEYWIGGVL